MPKDFVKKLGLGLDKFSKFYYTILVSLRGVAMLLELKQLFDVVDDEKRIDYSLDLSDYRLFQNCPFPKPVKIKGKVFNRAGIVTLQLDVSTEAVFVCDRCLDEFQQPFHEQFEHILVRKLNSQSDDYIVVEDARLDLDELVLSDMLLSLPTKILCSEDCQGLCVNCGANLNVADCECGKQE